MLRALNISCFLRSLIITAVVSIAGLGCKELPGSVNAQDPGADISDLNVTADMQKILLERRGRMADAAGSGIIIVGSGSVPSGEFCEYRVNSNFFYLTGFDKPWSVAVIGTNTNDSYTLYLRERSRMEVIFNGDSGGNDEIIATCGFDTIRPMGDLAVMIRESVRNGVPLFIDQGDSALRSMVLSVIKEQGQPETLMNDLAPLVEEMRVTKDETEIARMQKAINITGEAFVHACRTCRPGMYEFGTEGLIEYIFRSNGAARPAFPSITGSGPNAVILHYSDNNRRMSDSELLLMDIGAEYGYYAADISRTIPVNGRFTREQNEIYSLVLKAQKAAIGELTPGKPLFAGHSKATSVIARGLYDLGLMTDTTSKWQKEFYTLYQINHYLGLDVHDAGSYGLSAETGYEYLAVDTAIGRPLEKGMVLTVEPGIYFREEALGRLHENHSSSASEEEITAFIEQVGPVYEKYVNIGIRIEDDVLITEDGYKVLSAEIPKEIDEIERLMSTGRRGRGGL